jgi:Zn ribbon nucleic-acid-binding protein
MQPFGAFWVKMACPHFGSNTDYVVTSERHGKYHVECTRCGHKTWIDKQVIDKLGKRTVATGTNKQLQDGDEKGEFELIGAASRKKKSQDAAKPELIDDFDWEFKFEGNALGTFDSAERTINVNLDQIVVQVCSNNSCWVSNERVVENVEGLADEFYGQLISTMVHESLHAVLFLTVGEEACDALDVFFLPFCGLHTGKGKLSWKKGRKKTIHLKDSQDQEAAP